jgi:hypothetical protein
MLICASQKTAAKGQDRLILILHRDILDTSAGNKILFPTIGERLCRSQFRQLLRTLAADVRFGSKVDMCGAIRDVCFVPIADITASLDPRERAAMEARLDQVLWRS